MDLKTFKDVKIVHLIDLATRYSVGVVMESKHKEVIVDKIFKHWIAIFGPPEQFFSDNGGEFNNDIREMPELLNVKINTTAAEATWSNGIFEHQNAVLENMFEKILDDTKCSIEVALAWALCVKNALSNVFGYSSNQLVFGKNPNFPSLINNNPPALEGTRSSELIAKQFKYHACST